MFCPIPNIETQKKWKFSVFGPSKEVFFSKFFFINFFSFVIKLKHSMESCHGSCKLKDFRS